MKTISIVAVIAGVLIGLMLRSCGVLPDDAPFVKARADGYYTMRGFTVLGYQGYNIWPIGKCYWYTLQRSSNVYESCLLKWGGEVHEYSLRAIDAVRTPNVER